MYVFIPQQAVLSSDELIKFRYADTEAHLVWPDSVKLGTFKEKQAPALLDAVATTFHGASRICLLSLASWLC